MASSKERLRWERQFDAITRRMDRQRDSLTRLMVLLTEANAALFEIEAVGKEIHDDAGEWEAAAGRASARAREAIERMAEMAAAVGAAVEESDQQFRADMEEVDNG